MTGPDDIAILRIELECIEPLIWRRVGVRTSMNFKAVYSVIQAVMSWLDCHLWEFTANERKYSMSPIPYPPLCSDPRSNRCRSTHFGTLQLNDDILTLDVAKIAQACPQCFYPAYPSRCGAEPEEPDDLRWLLRTRCKRPCRHVAEQRNELPPPHSITSSAMESTLAGMVRPRALAVVRLMTNSNLVVCSTGRSAVLAPLITP